MKELRKAIDDLPLIVKIILALPCIDGIIWGIYRICRGDIANIILGIVWIFFGSTVGWILDIVFLALGKPVFELTDETINKIKNLAGENDKSDDKKDNENGKN